MKAPQIIMIVMLAINLFDAMRHHGKPKEGNVSFWVTFLAACIDVALLWWGGFWG